MDNRGVTVGSRFRSPPHLVVAITEPQGHSTLAAGWLMATVKKPHGHVALAVGALMKRSSVTELLANSSVGRVLLWLVRSLLQSLSMGTGDDTTSLGFVRTG